jgi:hypothetical protein
MAGRKKNSTGIARDSEKQDEHNGAYSNEGEQGQLKQSMKPGGRKVPTANGKCYVEDENPTNTEDGMEHYSVNVGFIDVRFMCDNGKGFNVA